MGMLGFNLNLCLFYVDVATCFDRPKLYVNLWEDYQMYSNIHVLYVMRMASAGKVSKVWKACL